MPLQIVEAPPSDLLASLHQLVGSVCPFPACTRSPATVIMLRQSRRDRPIFENCLLLCGHHAEQARLGSIEIGMLRTVRQLLRPSRPSLPSATKILGTREEYLTEICDDISSGTDSLRCMYVGPLPLHPQWYFAMQEGLTRLPSMDRAVHDCLASPSCVTYTIYRNNPRYLDKVRSVIPPNLLAPLLQEIEANIELLYADRSDNRLVCADTGVFHIPIILDSVAVSALRAKPETPIEGGVQTTDPEHVEWEKRAFDRMFQHYQASSGDAVADLVTYVRSLAE